MQHTKTPSDLYHEVVVPLEKNMILLETKCDTIPWVLRIHVRNSFQSHPEIVFVVLEDIHNQETKLDDSFILTKW